MTDLERDSEFACSVCAAASARRAVPNGGLARGTRELELHLRMLAEAASTAAMDGNDTKGCLAVVAVIAGLFVFVAVGAVILFVAAFVGDRPSRRNSWPVLHVPPVEQWSVIPLSVDASLHCPTPVICCGTSHLGPHVAPDEPCCDWHFDVFVNEDGEQCIHMSSGGDGNYNEVASAGHDDLRGESFDFVLASNSTWEHARVFGRAFNDYLGEKALQSLSGVVTVSTLDWREGDPVHVHFELRYFYDDDAENWSTIEVCADAAVTIED